MRGYPECSLVSSECNSRSLPKGEWMDLCYRERGEEDVKLQQREI